MFGCWYPGMLVSIYELRTVVAAYLEGKMLKEVCSAIGFIRFRPRSSINPHTDRRSLSPRRVLSCNLKESHESIGTLRASLLSRLTVSPLDRVVVSVFKVLLLVTGVAKPLFNGDAPRAARLRRPCVRFRANRREAMAVVG